ncbi:uncharacterized mitochondrial protein AtMg00810-like [Lathyrus oleraceus]|uniref:uncharacterized mitochondrial protein AtMg00810-like n=1 Tax=Pisum sativum TaxID=3888 RepID=UPI0021D00EDA|nr:uncharacterized mitochondrial protein AtMg00810-like [Pisum sativum]
MVQDIEVDSEGEVIQCFMLVDYETLRIEKALKKRVWLKAMKEELELLKRFELLNCKVVVTPLKTNHKLDSDSEGDVVDVTTFKKLVGFLRYLCNTRHDICYAVRMDLEIKVNKTLELMIYNKSAINLAKNPVLNGRSNHIETKYHFMRN